MARIFIDIVQSEFEEIHDLGIQLETGMISEDQYKDGLIRILGEALPRGPERDDEIHLRVVKRTSVGYNGRNKVVH